MDILVSSNLERLLYLLSGDAALVAGLMKDLNEKGSYTVLRSLIAFNSSALMELIWLAPRDTFSTINCL